jgi:hypothetical protein
VRYDPIPGTEEDLTDYRGSIVNLEAATSHVRAGDVAKESGPSGPALPSCAVLEIGG